MDAIQNRIKELLIKAKKELLNKKVDECIMDLKLILALDESNEEAKYVLGKLSKLDLNFNTPLQKKIIVVLGEKNKIDKELVNLTFNNVEIGDFASSNFIHFTAQNKGKIKVSYNYIDKYIDIEKNQSLIIDIRINELSNDFILDIKDYENYDHILNLAKQLICDKKFELAQLIVQQLIMYNPECSLAYIYLILIDKKITDIQELVKNKILIDDDINYLKALEHSNDEYRNELISLANSIRENIYEEGLKQVSINNLELAIKNFESILKYKDSKEKVASLKRELDEIREKEKQLVHTEKIYHNNIIKLKNPNVIQLQKAINNLESIVEYKDSKNFIELYNKKIENIETSLKRKKKLFKKSLIYVIPTLIIIVLVTFLVKSFFVPSSRYDNAMEQINLGNYEEAKSILLDLGDFSDAKTQIIIVEALTYAQEGDYILAISTFEEIGDVEIEYDLDGGNNLQLTSLSLDLLLLDQTPTKTGYVFNDWKLIDFQVTNDKKEYKANVILKATYNMEIYTIHYYLNGGVGVESQTYNISSEDFLLDTPTKEGYSFGGWYETPSLTGQEVSFVPNGNIGDYHFYAKWIPNEYRISFNTMGGTINQDYINVTYGLEVTLPTPYRDDYIFDGWYHNDQNIDNGVWEISDNIELEARWIYKYYQVFFENNIGSLYTGSLDVVYNEDYQLPIPSEENYVFIGWFRNEELFSNNGKWSDTKDITLVAKWESIFTFTSTNNQVTITGFQNNFNNEILNFPNEIFGIKVTEINFQSNDFLNQVTHITIPNSVEKISHGAFFGASNLQSITIPFVGDSRSHVYDSAFGYIFGNKEFENTYLVWTSYDLYYIPNTLKEIIVNDSEVIGKYAFYDLESVETIIIPQNTTKIEFNAFDSLPNLEKLVIPLSVTIIERFAISLGHKPIYIENESKPEGWDADFESRNFNLIWNYSE